jgi:galactose mutarotase-like enzyme
LRTAWRWISHSRYGSRIAGGTFKLNGVAYTPPINNGVKWPRSST